MRIHFTQDEFTQAIADLCLPGLTVEFDGIDEDGVSIEGTPEACLSLLTALCGPSDSEEDADEAPKGGAIYRDREEDLAVVFPDDQFAWSFNPCDDPCLYTRWSNCLEGETATCVYSGLTKEECEEALRVGAAEWLKARGAE